MRRCSRISCRCFAPDDSVETVDVDSSVALERRYGLRIPVLAAGDVELSGYPLDRERVRLYLESK